VTIGPETFEIRRRKIKRK